MISTINVQFSTSFGSIEITAEICLKTEKCMSFSVEGWNGQDLTNHYSDDEIYDLYLTEVQAKAF